MKVKELMIGDWFHNNYTNENYQVWPTFLSQATNFGKRMDATFEDINISPIPLTAEILKRSGFEVQDQGGGRKDVWAGFGIDCEGDIEIEFQDNIPVHLKIDGGFRGEYYTSANIKYVHQLQHALRLCGIEKEIEL